MMLLFTIVPNLSNGNKIHYASTIFSARYNYSPVGPQAHRLPTLEIFVHRLSATLLTGASHSWVWALELVSRLNHGHPAHLLILLVKSSL